jgi:hypothetical protein
MAEILIQPTNEAPEWWEFEVEVKEEKSSTSHTVSMSKEFYSKITGGQPIEPQEVIRKTFMFLLDREAKETILGRFDLSSVSRYFPDYEDVILREFHIKK